eukprot:1870308-Amphidinium_carterae.1
MLLSAHSGFESNSSHAFLLKQSSVCCGGVRLWPPEARRSGCACRCGQPNHSRAVMQRGSSAAV